MTGRIQEQWQELRERFAAQPRLRAGVLIVAALLLFNLLFVLGDMRRASIPELQQLADRHARLEQVLAEGDWQARAEAARAQAEAIENLFWPASSLGLARAEFQTWLEGQARASGLELGGIEFRSSVELEALPGFFRLGARLDAAHDPNAMIRFLARISASDRIVSVDALRMGNVRNARSSIDLHAVFRLRANEVES